MLSPAYAKPHWLLGNLLLRTSNTAEAIRELRICRHQRRNALAERH